VKMIVYHAIRICHHLCDGEGSECKRRKICHRGHREHGEEDFF
jgi:hypothetical protein